MAACYQFRGDSAVDTLPSTSSLHPPPTPLPLPMTCCSPLQTPLTLQFYLCPPQSTLSVHVPSSPSPPPSSSAPPSPSQTFPLNTRSMAPAGQSSPHPAASTVSSSVPTNSTASNTPTSSHGHHQCTHLSFQFMTLSNQPHQTLHYLQRSLPG